MRCGRCNVGHAAFAALLTNFVISATRFRPVEGHRLLRSQRVRPQEALLPDRNISSPLLLDIRTEVHHVAAVNPLFNILDFIEGFVGNNWTNTSSAVNFTGVHPNSDDDLQTTLSAVRFSGGMAFVTVLVFAFLLQVFPAVYAHRSMEEFSDDGNPSLSKPRGWSMVSWAVTAAHVEDKEVVQLIGLDALMLLKFFDLCKRIIMIIGPAMMLFLAPLHYYIGSKVKFDGWTRQVMQIDWFSRFGISTMTSTWELHYHDASFVAGQEFDNTVLCWAHVAMVFFVVIVTTRSIDQAHSEFLKFRWEWLRSLQAPRVTTLLVEGIPPAQRSDQSLHAYFSKLFSAQAILRAYVVRSTWTLQRKIANVRRLEDKLAAAQDVFVASGRSDNAYFGVTSYLSGRRGQTVIEAINTQLVEAREAVRQERARVELAQANRDPKVSSSSGFITFTTRRWCRLASREQIKADSSEMKLSQPPDPQDVRYDDLASDRMAQQGSSISAFLLTACVFVFWVPLTAFISGFTSLEELKQFRGLSFLNDLPISMERLLEGVFAQLGLKLVLALLPTVLMIIINCNFLKSGNEAQLRMQNRYFVFLVTFVVLVSAMSMTLLHTLKMIAADPKEISVLFKKLPDSSHFYINYLIVGWFTLAMALLRISPLVKYMLFKTASSSPAEARASSEPEDQNGDGMGARMANVTLMMTIFLVFCACSPSIALAAFVWFVFGSHVYRWLVLYAETKKPDLGGAFWDAAIKHLFGSLCLYIGLMFVLLINAPWGAGKPAGAVLICGCGLLLKYLKHRSIIWKSMPYEAVVDSDEADRRDGKRRPSLMQSAPETERYAQEECLVPKHEESQVLAMQAQADASALQIGGKPGKRSDGS